MGKGRTGLLELPDQCFVASAAEVQGRLNWLHNMSGKFHCFWDVRMSELLSDVCQQQRVPWFRTITHWDYQWYMWMMSLQWRSRYLSDAKDVPAMCCSH